MMTIAQLQDLQRFWLDQDNLPTIEQVQRTLVPAALGRTSGLKSRPSVQQAAELLGVAERTLRSWLQKAPAWGASLPTPDPFLAVEDAAQAFREATEMVCTLYQHANGNEVRGFTMTEKQAKTLYVDYQQQYGGPEADGPMLPYDEWIEVATLCGRPITVGAAFDTTCEIAAD